MQVCQASLEMSPFQLVRSVPKKLLRTSSQEQDLGLAFDLLHGNAMAHETIHCRLGPAHSHSGLMRWDRKDGEAIGLQP